jgi:hypothetical protein
LSDPLLSFESEISQLRPRLGDPLADTLIARERREVFSVHAEVRIAAWAGALLVASAVGVFIKNNFDLFDRAFLAGAIGVMAAACYAWCWKRSGIVSDYVLLLGALILSADVGFIEQQFDLFGEHGERHFLLLALIHGVTAYRFGSRLVLSLSIAALAAWMGLDRNLDIDDSIEFSLRAFACAAVVLVWRFLNRNPDFSRVFEHFAANLALWGGLLLLRDAPSTACLITLTLAALVIAWGFRTGVESFVLYAFVYAVIAIDGWLLEESANEELVILISMLVAIPALVALHRRFRRNA